MILWHYFGHIKSTFNIPFFIMAFYLGQSVKLSTRKTFMILLQIWIFMAFVLGYCYQGSITSFMIQNHEKPLLHSIDELFQSSHKIIIGDRLNALINDSLKYQKAFHEGRVNKSGSKISFFDYAKVFENKFVVMLECDLAKGLVDSGKIEKVYVIDDILMSSFIQLHVVHMSKFLKRWQLIMDRCFEAGLPKAWENFQKIGRSLKFDEDEDDEILRLREVLLIFCELIIGFALAGLALIIEILYHKYLQPFIEHFMLLREVRRLKRNAFAVALRVRRF